MQNTNQDLAGLLRNCSQAMEEFQKINMKYVRQLSDLQMNFLNLWMDCNRDQMDRLARAETPSDVVAAESGVVTEYMNKFASNAQQSFDALSKAQDEMFHWLQDNAMTGPMTGGKSTGQARGTRKSSASTTAQ